jgi:peptidoglycan/xylan/chitin deacetylase (PgdA/CDA1 family)
MLVPPSALGKLPTFFRAHCGFSMRVLLMAASLLPGLVAFAPGLAAQPSRTELALFQERTIFHSGLPRAHTIALTFDDGPNTNTAGVLDALKAMNIKATFFVVGSQARRNPQLLARIAAEGHLLENHSASHAQLTERHDRNPQLLLDEIRGVDELIAPWMSPGDKLYFRAPYGYWKSQHAGILNRDARLRKYVGPIYWDVGGQISMSRDGYVMAAADWDCWRIGWKPQTCAKGYLHELRRKDGGVVLMHSIHRNSEALVRAVVPALIEEGYSFVRLDQMPEYRQYETAPSGGTASAATLEKLARLDTVK